MQTAVSRNVLVVGVNPLVSPVTLQLPRDTLSTHVAKMIIYFYLFTNFTAFVGVLQLYVQSN